MNKFMSRIKWIFTVSQRFSRVDTKGRSATTSFLASLGICFGVMTLIVVVSVMNGFQRSYIDSIMEVSSYHIRLSGLSEDDEKKLLDFSENNKRIKSCTSFYEAQSLITTSRAREGVALIRAINPDVYETDSGFRNEVKMISGDFDLSEDEFIIIGSQMARDLNARLGSVINLFALSGGSDVELISDNRIFRVAGIYRTGFVDINSTYVFINQASGKHHFGKEAKKIFGIKLKNQNDDANVLYELKKMFPDAEVVSWREYNKTFFGALKIEKNILMILVALIFIVVAINIYNGMRRLVFERRTEISMLSALGARGGEIKFIFILQGFWGGVKGSVPGLLLGLLISINSSAVFSALSKIMYWAVYIVTKITAPQNLLYVTENPMYAVYAAIPARVFLSEAILITLFGIISPLVSSWAASRNVLKMNVAEVLHNE